MHNSESIYRASHTCVANASETPDGRFYPSITIHEGGTIAGPLIHRDNFPGLVFDLASGARMAGAEYIDNWLSGWKIQGAKQSQSLGNTYGYAGRVTPQNNHAWEAKVYRGGDYCGVIGGSILDDHLSGVVLDGLVRTLIEFTIDSGAGFQA